VPKKSASRQRDEWRRKYESVSFLTWTQSRVSVASGLRGCECHHVHPDEGLPVGGGRKADACWIVPLTPAEHRELHNRGERTFEKRYGITLADEAREHWAKWKELEG